MGVDRDELEGRTLGDFVVAEKIGEGGFGAVYRARQTQLDRPAVIKVLHTRHRATAAATERFLREARLASRLDHPYAAHIYAFGAEADGTFWIAMELVRGTTLSEYVRVHGPLPVDKLVPLLERICEVVHSAHEQGIIHRDLKPANVMVVARAGRLLPKLLDFGIAKSLGDALVEAERGASSAVPGPTSAGSSNAQPEAIDDTVARNRTEVASDDTVDANTPPSKDATPSEAATHAAQLPDRGPRRVVALFGQLTQHGAMMGSPHYMAPEQWADATTVTVRSDLYALGALAYEALCGKPPFTGSSVAALANAHKTAIVPPVPASLPRSLDAAFARALAKRPEDRYGNALELAAAFRHAAGLAEEHRPLPQLEASVREQYLALAPRPVAEAIAVLDAARHPRQARDALWTIPRVLGRWIALVALAARSRIGNARDAAGTVAAIQRLGTALPTDDEWLDLAHAIARGHGDEPDLHPVPELVMLLCSAGSDDAGEGLRLYRELCRQREPLAEPSASDDTILERLRGALVTLSALLRSASFVCAYRVVVPTASDRAELWIGSRSAHRLETSIRGAPTLGQPLLVDADGGPVLALHPLVQVAEPAPGVANELFLYDGRSARGPRLTAPPASFELHDQAIFEWLRVQVTATFDDEAATQVERPPYRGLAAFTVEDAGLYVGREQQVDAFVNRMRVQPLVTVVGPSGAGKSSFVHAGVLPALERWRAIIVRPGPAPFSALASRLAMAGIAIANLEATLHASPARLGELLRDAATADHPIVLVIDQLEELFTLVREPTERQGFATAIVSAARSVDDSVRVVMTLRDDFLVAAQTLDGLRDRLTQGLLLLTTPSRDDLVRMLVEPARRVGYEFEDPELPPRMVAEIADRPGGLALLSFTAARLWDHRDRHFRRLTTTAYEQLGGVGGALARHAETMLESIPAHEQRLIREAFRHLVTGEGTRAVLTRRELAAVMGGGAAAQRVIERLVASRLLVAREGDAEEQIEVAHEALIEAWPRLVEWQREDRDGARLRDQLRAAARQWDARDRPRGLLWRDEALVEYELWRTRYPGTLTAVEDAFGNASVAEAARGKRLRRGFVAIAFAVLAVGLVVVLWFAKESEAERRHAERARRDAQASEQKAQLQAAELREEYGRTLFLAGTPLRAAAYLQAAHASGSTSVALEYLLARTTRMLEKRIVTLGETSTMVDRGRYGRDGRIYTVSRGTLRVWDATGRPLAATAGHTGNVFDLELSRDGKMLVTAGEDKTARVWSSDGALLHTLAGHAKEVVTARFDVDARRVLTASMDGTARLWDAGTGALVAELRGHAGAVTDAVFASDSIITSGIDGSLRSWDLAGAPRSTRREHPVPVASIALASDARMLATAHHDGSVALWTLSRLELVRVVKPPEQRMASRPAFSPDGTRIAISGDERLSVFDVATGARQFTAARHRGTIVSLMFDPSGTRIASASHDGTVRLWDARTGQETALFPSVELVVWVAFAPDGQTLIMGGGGGASLWRVRDDLRAAVLEGFAGSSGSIAFSPDGARIAATEDVGPVRQWNVETGAPLAPLGRHPAAVGALAYDASATRIATGGGDGVVRIFAIETGAQLHELATPSRASINAIDTSPDGHRIVTAHRDGKARVWNATTGALERELGDGTQPLYASAWSRTHGSIATCGRDGKAQIWSADTGRVQQTLLHDHACAAIAFDATSERVITASRRTARIWRVTSGTLEASFEGHELDITNAAFGPAGMVVTTSFDGTASLWDAGTGRLVDTIEHHEPVATATFSSDGRRLATLAGDRIFVWILPTRLSAAAERAILDSLPFVLRDGLLVPRVRK